MRTPALRTIPEHMRDDSPAFEQVYEQYREHLSWHICRLVGNQELAEDLVQDTFMRAYKALPRMPADLRMSSWLYRIATNICYDALRRRKLIAWQPLDEQLEQALGAGDDPQEAYGGKTDLVRATMLRLSMPYRQALLLHEVEGYPLPEIAQALGIAPSSIKMVLSRARKQFRRHYHRLEQEAMRDKSANLRLDQSTVLCTSHRRRKTQ